MAPLIASDHFAFACTWQVVQSTSGRNAVAREYASQQWTKIVLILIRQQDRKTDPIELLPVRNSRVLQIVSRSMPLNSDFSDAMLAPMFGGVQQKMSMTTPVRPAARKAAVMLWA